MGVRRLGYRSPLVYYYQSSFDHYHSLRLSSMSVEHESKYRRVKCPERGVEKFLLLIVFCLLILNFNRNYTGPTRFISFLPFNGSMK